MKPRVITLEPSNEGDSIAVSFEEAFGEFSEARGRGRARRKKRRLERVKSRAEVRAERRKARKEAMADRLEKRKVRKTARVERKGIGQEAEDEMNDQTQNEMVDKGSSTQSGGGSMDQGSTPETTGSSSDSSSDDQGNDQGNEQGGGSGWGENANATYTPSDSGEGDDEGSSESSDDEGSSDEESSFDGVHPAVKDVARKIEWNKEMVSRLESRKRQLQMAMQTKGQGRNGANIRRELSLIDSRIADRKSRIAQLESHLNDFSNASGKHKHQAKKAIAHARAERMKVTHKASPKVKEIAKKLAKVYPPAIAVKKAKEMVAKRQLRHGGDVTPVEADMNPEFEENYIEVPAQSNFNGRGIIGMDQANDYDADQPRVVELYSNASGSEPKNKIVPIAIGLGVGVALIYGITKLMKK